MREEELQDRLAEYFLYERRMIIVPNVMLYGYEADLMLIDKDKLIEIEIKTNYYDFMNDFKNKAPKHMRIRNGRQAHKFYFCTPEDSNIPRELIPDGYGLITVGKSGINITRAKIFRKEQMTQHEISHMINALNHRYWRQRIRGVKENDFAL